MADINQLKYQARREEQRENWSRAIELYRRALDLSERTMEVAPDVSLYNRIGDLHLRRDDTQKAISYYLEAVDQYAEQGLHSGAIALCNKILRVDPARNEVHRKLGQLHVATELMAEARNCYRRYARSMEQRGEVEKGIEGLLEFADLTSDEDVRLDVVERLAELGSNVRAASELKKVWEARREAGEDASELRARILELNPDIEMPPAPGEPAVAEGEPAAVEEDEVVPTEEEVEIGPPPESLAAAEEEPAGAEPDDELEELFQEVDVEGSPAEVAEEEEVPAEDPVAALQEELDEARETEDEDELEVRLRYARLLRREGRTESAIEELEKVVEAVTEDEPRRALAVLEELVELAPDRLEHHRRRAELAAEIGDDEALVAAYLTLGDRLRAQEASEAARSAYERVLEVAPDNERAQQALSDLREEEVVEEAPSAGAAELPTEEAAASVEEAAPSVEEAAPSEEEAEEREEPVSQEGIDFKELTLPEEEVSGAEEAAGVEETAEPAPVEEKEAAEEEAEDEKVVPFKPTEEMAEASAAPSGEEGSEEGVPDFTGMLQQMGWLGSSDEEEEEDSGESAEGSASGRDAESS